MPKLHKTRRRQKFQFGKNRKRSRRVEEKGSKHLIKVTNDTIKASWDNSKPAKDNLDTMGLAYDPNKVVKHLTAKKKMVESLKENAGTAIHQTEVTPTSDSSTATECVVRQLEEEVASIPRKSSFRFPPEQVRFITYMMSKYGEDYKAMARDRRNEWQETPKQIKQKIVKFRSIPEQFAKYARENGLLDKVNQGKEDVTVS